jgi:hypothetical protein
MSTARRTSRPAAIEFHPQTASKAAAREHARPILSQGNTLAIARGIRDIAAKHWFPAKINSFVSPFVTNKRSN